MGNKTVKSPVLRRLAILVAALGMLAMSSGIALMSTASAAVGTNQEEYWETLPNEVCTKTDTGADAGAYTVPAAPEGFVWSKLIIKKGAGNIGDENQVFNNPVAGDSYTWLGFDPKQNGGWSHTILCAVPVVVEEPDLATAAITVTQPDCDNENTADLEFSGTNVVLPFEVDGTVGPGETVTVTATAVEGAEFSGGSDTKVFDDVVFGDAEEGCDVVVLPPDVATAEIVVTQPTCDNENTPAIDFSGTNVVLPFGVVGAIAPGETATVTATALEGAEFDGGDTSKVFDDVIFDEAETGCDEVVNPPGEEPPGEETQVEPPSVTPAVVTPTVVASGILPAGADLRGEQGLALLVAGMILMGLAAGLGRPGAVRS